MARTACLTLTALALAVVARPTSADVVVLTGGKRIEDVVVSRNDDQWVVINPWNSRLEAMTWEIPEENRIPRSKVAEVVIADPPLVELRRRESKRGLTVADHLALAELAKEAGHKAGREHHLRLARALDPGDAEAAAAYADSKFDKWRKGNPLADAELAKLEAEWLAADDGAALGPLWKRMKDRRTTRELAYLARARRSAALPRGRRDEVAVTWRSSEVPGATYCIFVPKDYDPLVPTPLVIGLHGGGRGGVDETLVTGSGESAMNFYEREAGARGWIVVCPTARAAPWSHRNNEVWFDVLLEELRLLYNVDESRVYLTGHSMGGFGTWHWGAKLAEVWAACSPCAGGGDAGGIRAAGLPIYVYHGADDGIVGPSMDRTAAKSLASGKKPHDFVYTELDGVGHGFPAEVRDAIFEFFAGRRKEKGRKLALEPVSSFDRKVEKGEVKLFGDPRKLPKAVASADSGGSVKDLLAAIERGGSAGADAVAPLAERADGPALKSLTRLLKDDDSSTDTKVLAARTLGLIATDKVLRPLERALADDDYRVLDEATTALGRTGLPKALAPLAKAAATMGARYDASFYTGRRMTHTEYNTRLASFERLCEAYAELGLPDAVPVLEKELVARVLTPIEKPEDTTDERFRREPPAARAGLTRALATCLVKLADPRGVDLLTRVAATWPEEAPLVRAAEAGIEQLEALAPAGE
jgi:poly(3-hydroxybutyrate) depolymerase